MIWIQSNNEDFSTNYVIDWLYFFDAKWIRTNEESISFKELSIMNNQKDLEFSPLPLKGQTVKLENLSSYWYRRGSVNLGIKIEGVEPSYRDYINYLSREGYYYKQYIYDCLNNIRHINSFYDNDLNKLTVTNFAQSIDLKIPDTHIITSKNQLLHLLNGKEVITKSLLVSSVWREDKKVESWGTVKVEKEKIMENLELIPDHFFPSLVQECIEKKFEIRTFYLDDQFYSSAIFSQNDPQTKIDFRNYNYQKPNRVVPFKLPESIEKQLYELSKRININSGSIDLIYGTDNKFYFLEINPIGQFHQVSYPCNYYIEKYIANYLNCYG